MLSCLGDMNGAMETIDESLQANQNSAAGLAGRGMLRAKVGDLNGAIEDLTRSVELEPQNIEAFDEKAKVERSLGNE